MSADRPGRPPADRGPGYDRALTELREALELPIVGYPRREQELAELRRLIGVYVEEARQMLAEREQA